MDNRMPDFSGAFKDLSAKGLSPADMQKILSQPLFNPDFDCRVSIDPAKMDNKNLKLCYELCCIQYQLRLCRQWDLDVRDSWWVPSDRPGETLVLQDLNFSIGMEDVRLFVDCGISYQAFRRWWDYCYDALSNEAPLISSYNWFVKGCRPEALKD